MHGQKNIKPRDNLEIMLRPMNMELVTTIESVTD